MSSWSPSWGLPRRWSSAGCSGGSQSATDGVTSEFIGWLARLSFFFAALNAVPGFPLDGGRMLMAAVWGITGNRRTAMRVTGYVGLAIGIATVAAAVWMLTTGGQWVFLLGYMGFVMVMSGRAMERRIEVRDQLIRGTRRRRDAADARHPARGHDAWSRRWTHTCAAPTAGRSRWSTKASW